MSWSFVQVHGAKIVPASNGAMHGRFTDRARKVMQLANQEAQRFNHEYIGTEHILLGLVKEGSGVAANVLKNLEVDLRKIRLEVDKIVQSGPDMVTMGKLPQTPRAKRVVEFAIDEAGILGTDWVGTEHLLLGLIREQEGVAAQVLMHLGVNLIDVRQETLEMLGVRNQKACQEIVRYPFPPVHPPLLEEVLTEFGQVEWNGREFTKGDLIVSADAIKWWCRMPPMANSN